MSETLVNQIDNKNIYASRAVADEDGTNIKTSYALKSEIPTVPTMKNLVAGTNVSITETANGIEISASGGGGTQVQADWTEQDSSDPSYIQNKPTQKTITAGTGIAITESQNSLSVYTDPNVIPTKTEINTALAGKQGTLTAGANITIDANNEISAADTTYTSGANIAISANNEISATYTAGAGISISNGVISALYNETVLWNETTFADNLSGSVVLSETAKNFSKLMITFIIETTTESYVTPTTKIFDMEALAALNNYTVTLDMQFIASDDNLLCRSSKVTMNGTTFSETMSKQWYSGGVSTMVNPLHIIRVVGINRIASN